MMEFLSKKGKFFFTPMLVFYGNTEPNPNVYKFWYNTDDNKLYVYDPNSSQWKVSTQYTPEEVVNLVKQADGPGSGIDADTVDGFNASKDPAPNSLVATDETGKVTKEVLPDEVVQNTLNNLIKKPSVSSVQNGIVTLSDFQTSPYYNGQHTATDWEIATSQDFSSDSIVWSSYNDTTHLTSLNLSDISSLQPGVTYYIRARYVSGDYRSDWTDPVTYEIPVAPTINSINWSSSTFYENNSYTVTIDATSQTGDPLSYSITCDDPNVTITQDSNQPNKFTITFPDYSQDTDVTFTFTVTDTKTNESTVKTQTVTVKTISIIFKTITYGSHFYVNRSTVDSQGNIFVVGGIYDSGSLHPIIAKFNVNGDHIKTVKLSGGKPFTDVVYDSATDQIITLSDSLEIIAFDTDLNINKQIQIRQSDGRELSYGKQIFKVGSSFVAFNGSIIFLDSNLTNVTKALYLRNASLSAMTYNGTSMYVVGSYQIDSTNNINGCFMASFDPSNQTFGSGFYTKNKTNNYSEYGFDIVSSDSYVIVATKVVTTYFEYTEFRAYTSSFSYVGKYSSYDIAKSVNNFDLAYVDYNSNAVELSKFKPDSSQHLIQYKILLTNKTQSFSEIGSCTYNSKSNQFVSFIPAGANIYEIFIPEQFESLTSSTVTNSNQTTIEYQTHSVNENTLFDFTINTVTPAYAYASYALKPLSYTLTEITPSGV